MGTLCFLVRMHLLTDLKLKLLLGISMVVTVVVIGFELQVQLESKYSSSTDAIVQLVMRNFNNLLFRLL